MLGQWSIFSPIATILPYRSTDSPTSSSQINADTLKMKINPPTLATQRKTVDFFLRLSISFLCIFVLPTISLKPQGSTLTLRLFPALLEILRDVFTFLLIHIFSKFGNFEFVLLISKAKP